MQPGTSIFRASREEWRVKVFAVGDRLLIGERPVAEAPDGSWRYTDPERATEKIWFENFASGRPQHLNMSGYLFDRLHDTTR